jgi:hypothetical protein
VFPRGAGSQTINSITYSQTLGTTNGDTVQGHNHYIYGNTTNVGSSAGYGIFPAESGSNASGNRTGSGATNSYATDMVTTLASDGTHGAPRIGFENAPANVVVNYIIAYV